ncbi:hypothetical protein QBC39DRAFT_409320 [Podospora conica]|nr:hypothetical protein QBC39DRAFT_409320 [Schizothecium conicum]
MRYSLGKALLAWLPLVLLFSSIAMANPVQHDAALEPISSRHTTEKQHPNSPYGGTSPPRLPVTISANIRLTGLLCGKFSTADRPDVSVLVNVMADLDNNGVDNDNCNTPARTCRRHACKNTSGVYVCNDNYHDLELSCLYDVALVAQPMLNKCCQKGMHKGTSGQQFVDGYGYNVIVGYANCNHGRDEDLPDMGPPSDPWGPNGACVER